MWNTEYEAMRKKKIMRIVCWSSVIFSVCCGLAVGLFYPSLDVWEAIIHGLTVMLPGLSAPLILGFISNWGGTLGGLLIAIVLVVAISLLLFPVSRAIFDEVKSWTARVIIWSVFALIVFLMYVPAILDDESIGDGGPNGSSPSDPYEKWSKQGFGENLDPNDDPDDSSYSNHH